MSKSVPNNAQKRLRRSLKASTRIGLTVALVATLGTAAVVVSKHDSARHEGSAVTAKPGASSFMSNSAPNPNFGAQSGTEAPNTWTPTSTPATTAPPTTSAPQSCTVSSLLVSSCGRWFGIAPQAFSGKPGPTALTYDENFTGSDFALVHEYHSNGTLFPTASDISMAQEAGHNRVLLENWKPGSDMTWAQVANGSADARIDAEAAYLKSHFDLPFYLTIWHEPENDVNPTAGSGKTADDYQAMYRHVILRLRADGANKFVSVMNYMGFGKWNTMLADLYPGDDVVDWIAYDPYQQNASAAPGHDFADMVNRTYLKSPGFYTWATTEHPGKPLMLAEWGAPYDSSNPGGQAAFFHSVTTEINQFPALKTLVYFDTNDSSVKNGIGTTPDAGATSLAGWKDLVTSAPFATPSIRYADGKILFNQQG